MLFKMSDEKSTTVEPTVIIASQPNDENRAKSRLTKKHIVTTVVALLITGLVVAGVLVGMKIYTDSNLEILKYTLKVNGLSQNVTVDNNVVTYHVQKDGTEAWIVQDFDKGIQVTKRLADGHANCFVTALNRSLAPDASSIPDTAPDTTGASSSTASYAILPDPIADLTFLGRKASAMCQNIPTYHAVPDCDKPDHGDAKLDNTTSGSHRSKRALRVCATCNAPNCVCICGCCSIWCADYSQGGIVCSLTTRYLGGGVTQYTCTFYYKRLYLKSLLTPTCIYGGYSYYPY